MFTKPILTMTIDYTIKARQVSSAKLEKELQLTDKGKEVLNTLQPNYYGGKDSPYEVFKIVEHFGLDKDAYLFNVLKYIVRSGKKDPTKEVEDLKKAMEYLNRRIINLEKCL